LTLVPGLGLKQRYVDCNHYAQYAARTTLTVTITVSQNVYLFSSVICYMRDVIALVRDVIATAFKFLQCCFIDIYLY